MPVFQIESDGQTFEIESDREPTFEDVDLLLGRQPKPPPAERRAEIEQPAVEIEQPQAPPRPASELDLYAPLTGTAPVQQPPGADYTGPELLPGKPKPATKGTLEPGLRRFLFGRTELEREAELPSQAPSVADMTGLLMKWFTPPPAATVPIEKLTDPLVDRIPGTFGGVLAGMRDVLLHFPYGMAGLKTPQHLSKAVLGAFTGEFVFSLPEQQRAFNEAKERGDNKEAAKIATVAFGTGLLFAHGAAREFGPTPAGRPVVPRVPGTEQTAKALEEVGVKPAEAKPVEAPPKPTEQPVLEQPQPRPPPEDYVEPEPTEVMVRGEEFKQPTERPADAIQERKAEALPVEVPPEGSAEMGARVPKPEKPAEVREEAPPPEAEVAPKPELTEAEELRRAIPALEEQLATIKLRRKEIKREFQGVKRVSAMNRTTPRIERGQQLDRALGSLEVEESSVSKQLAQYKSRIAELESPIREEVKPVEEKERQVPVEASIGWSNPVQDAFTSEMERRGYKLELPRLPDNSINPNALEHQGSRYPTFVSPDGKVQLAVSLDVLFERQPGEVWRSGPSSFVTDGFTLEIITTDPKSRGAGLAGKVMRDVVAASDLSGAKLYGEIAPVKTMAGKKFLTREQLHEWYAKLGFKKTGKSLIERDPVSGTISSPVEPTPPAKPAAKPTLLTKRQWQQRQANEFMQLVRDNAHKFQWATGDTLNLLHSTKPEATGVGTMAIKGGIAISKAERSARRQAAKDLGLDPDRIGEPAYRAEHLQKLKEFVRQKEEFDAATQAGSEAGGQVEVPFEELKGLKTVQVEGETFDVARVEREFIELEDGRKFGRQRVEKGESVWVEDYQEKAGEPLKLAEPETVEQQRVRLEGEAESNAAKARLAAAEEAAVAKLTERPAGDLGTAGQGKLFGEPGQQEMFQPTAPSGEGVGIVPQPGKVARAAATMVGEAVRDIFQVARQAIAPKDKRGVIGDWYSEPMLERLDRKGKTESRRVAAEMRQVDSRSVELAGQIAPAVDRAKQLAGKAFRGGTTWVREIAEQPTARTGIARLHTLEGPDKAAILARVPAEARPMVEAVWDANALIGVLAQRANQNFQAGGKIQRILTLRGMDAVLKGEDSMLRGRWINGLARANKVPFLDVRKFFDRWKAELSKPSPDGGVLDSIAQDFVRNFPKAITHVKVGGSWVEVLVSDPVDYLSAALERTARAVAFREVYPANAAGKAKLIDDREKVLSELNLARDSKGQTEFDNLIRVIQGHPLDPGFRSVQSLIGGATGIVTAPLKAGMLSLANLVNAAETLVGGPAIFLGYKNVIPAFTRNPVRFYEQLEMSGMLNRATRNFAFNPTAPLRSLSRMVSQGIGRATMANAFNELQEYTGAASARIVADKARSGTLSEGAKKDLASVIRAMGIRDLAKVDAIVNGRDAEGLAQFERAAAPFLSMGHQRPALSSRWGNSRAFNALFWFHRYPQMVVNQARGIVNNLIEDVRRGDMDRGLRDAKLLARFAAGKTMQGALGYVLLQLVKQGNDPVKEMSEEARQHFGWFIWSLFANAVGGPLTLANRLGDQVHSGEDAALEVAKASAPASVWMDTLNMLSGAKSYGDLGPGERLGRWIKYKTPALSAALNQLNKRGLIESPGWARGEIYRLLDKWMERSDDPKIRAEWERRQEERLAPSRYRALVHALRRDDQPAALKAIAELEAQKVTKQDIAEYLNPDTEGSLFPSFRLPVPKRLTFLTAENEAKFKAGLSPAQQAIWRRAVKERDLVWRRFLELK